MSQNSDYMSQFYSALNKRKKKKDEDEIIVSSGSQDVAANDDYMSRFNTEMNRLGQEAEYKRRVNTLNQRIIQDHIKTVISPEDGLMPQLGARPIGASSVDVLRNDLAPTKKTNTISEEEEKEIVAGMNPTQKRFHEQSGGFVDTSTPWEEQVAKAIEGVSTDEGYKATDKLLKQLKFRAGEDKSKDITDQGEMVKFQEYYNQLLIAKHTDIFSKAKMDGTNHSVLEEMQLLADMDNGKEKDRRKEAVLQKMEALGVSAKDYALYTEDGNFSWESLRKFVGSNFIAGLASFWGGFASTANVILGGELMSSHGWENNPITLAKNYYDGVYAAQKQRANLAKERLGGGGVLDFADKALETTFATTPQAIVALMTSGASLSGGLSSTAAYEQAGNLLAKIGLKISSMMKNPQYWLSVGRTLGNDYEEAKSMGASDSTAILGATFTSLVNAGIETGVDGMSGIQGLPQEISEEGGSKLLKWAISNAEEMGEEGLQKFVNEAVTKVAYDHDAEILNPKEYAYEMALAGVSGAALGSGQIAVQSGANAVAEYQANKLTDLEQGVYDKVTESVIAEREQKYGRELTASEKRAVKKEVRENLDHGGINIDKIEEILGGDEYVAYKSAKEEIAGSDLYKAYREALNKEDSLEDLQKEYDELHNMPRGEMTGAQQDREAELKAQIEAIKNSPKSADLLAQLDPELGRLGSMKSKLSGNVYNIVKDSRLAESYREYARSKEAFTVDIDKYTDENARKVVQTILDSGLGDNSNAFHHTVDFLAKLAADDPGLAFDLTNNEKLKGTAHYKKGYTTNGFKITDENGTRIVLNVDSPNALRTVVGHEFTHVLEGTQLYKKLADSVFKYAETKEGLDNLNARIKEAERIYKGDKNTTPEKEVVADLIGEYVFTDSEFISNLAKTNHEGFMRLFDEIKYMARIATAGSKEARDLARVKNDFERIYREYSTGQNKTAESSVQRSIRKDIVDVNGKEYDSVVELDKEVSKRTLSSPKEMMKYIKKNLVGFRIPVLDENGNTEIIEFAGEKETTHKNNSKDRNPVLGELAHTTGDVRKQVVVNLLEVTNESVADPDRYSSNNDHGWLDKNGWKPRKTYVLAQDGNIYEAQLRIAKAHDGRNILYAVNLDINNGIAVDKSATQKRAAVIAAMPSGDKVAQNNPNVNSQHSFSKNSDGNDLTVEQQEYFKDSSVRDENGNLLVLYHGTQNNFTVFDIARSGENYDGWSELGEGIYLTPRKESAEYYGDNAGWGREVNLMEVYANIKKPFNTQDAVEFDISDLSQKYELTEYDERFMKQAGYRLVDFLKHHNESVRDYLTGKGFDGVWDKDLSGYVHQVVAYSENQIKNTDNLKPTSSPDIRYSLSENKDELLNAYQYNLEHGDLLGAELAVEGYANLTLPDSKIRDDNGRLIPVYHGTKEMFYEFDTSVNGGKNGTAEGFGIYLSDDPEVTNAYGDRQIKMFANITKPATSFEKTISTSTLVKLIKHTCEKEAQRMVDDGEYDSVEEAIKDTWVSNYVYTYGTSMEQAYREVAQTFLKQNSSDMDIVQEVMFGMAIRDYGTAMEFYRNSLTPITGIDGFITKWENSATGKTSNIYLAFDSSQLKSADAVTKDNAGNVIPLSERFNPNSKDIRRSLSSADEQRSASSDALMYTRGYRYRDSLAEIAPVKEEIAPVQEVAAIAEAQTPVETAETEQNVPKTKNDLTDAFNYFGRITEDSGTHNTYTINGISIDLQISAFENSNGNYTVSTTFYDGDAVKPWSVAQTFGTLEEAKNYAEGLAMEAADYRNGDQTPLQAYYGEQNLQTENVPVADSTTEATTDLFPNDLAPAESELSSLIEERTALEERLLEMVENGNVGEEFNRLSAQWDSINQRAIALENELLESESGRIDSLTDSDVPPEQEAPYPGDPTQAPDPFAGRDMVAVGNRKVKAYMYENPEVKPFFQDAALGMLDDLHSGTRGEKWFNDDVYYESGGEKGWGGTKRTTTDDIADLLDNWHYTYAEIEKGLNDIIEDNGKENNAVSKRIEFMLDYRLRNGYTGVWGEKFPPDQGYINLLKEREINEYSEEAFNRFMETADQYAPIAPVAEDAPVAPNPVAPAPVTNEAPVAEQYEAVTPKRTKEPKMVRVDTAKAEQVAKVLVDEPATNKQKTGLWSLAKEYVLDNGMVFEDLSKKTKNDNIESKWNFVRYARSMAQHLMKNGADGVRSLESIMSEVNGTGKTQKFFEYLYHMHNVDRMSLEGRYDGVPNKAVFGDSVTAEMSRAIASDMAKENPEFRRMAQDIYRYNAHLRQLLVDGGVISQETADLWAEMYPHYVPIRRADKSDLAINVPLDTRKTGVNAPVKRATGGSSDILNLFDTMGQRTIQTLTAVAKNRFGVELKNALGSVVDSSKASADEVIDSIDTHEELLQAGKNGMSPTFTVFENGEKVTFEITEEMYEAMKPTGKGLSYTSKLLNTASNFHRGLLTEYNPVFMITNAIKDAQDVVINSKHPLKTYARFPQAVQELKNKGFWYEEYMANGGEQNSYFDTDTNTFQEENKVLEGIKKWTGLGAISDANNFIERVPRLAEYIASRESGRSIEQSMLDAARVTTNFAAGGKLTKALNRNGFTFLNASMQGAVQQVRNIREAKMNGLKGSLILAAKYAAVGVPFMLLNGLKWKDDEDYEELSDYVKDNYYIVAKYGDGQFVRIPKGRTVAVIQNAFEQMGNLITGNDEVDLKRFGELLVSNLAPNNPLDNNILAPVVQAVTNKTWYGEELVPTRLQDLPATEQYDETTDSISRWLSEKAGKIGIDISPIKINYLMDQYTGGVGDTILPMLTPAAESGDNTLAGNLLAPFKDKFTTDSVLKNQNVSDFYEKVDELAANAKSSTATDEDILMSKYMNSVSASVGQLYGDKRTEQNTSLPDDQKYNMVRGVQQDIVDAVKEGLSNYEKVTINGEYATVGDMYFMKNKDGEWQKMTSDQVSKYKATRYAGDAPYASEGNNHYRYYTEEGKSEGDWRKLTDEQVAKQNKVTSTLGITPEKYWGNKEEYDYAYENPESYAVAKAVGGYKSYSKYSSDLYDIKADKDANGKSISGSRKNKVIDYINSLDIDYGMKLVLLKSEYTAEDNYNREIIEYINGRNDLSYEEKVTIYKKIGFNVSADGYITW